MAFVLGERSKAELIGVAPGLVALVELAIQITPQDFSVHDGLRTIEQQREYVARGASRTMDSKHLKQDDGFGHAVDLVPYINGRLRWEWPLIYPICRTVRAVALQHNLVIRWGGVWDRKLNELVDDPVQEVAAYVERRRALGQGAFLDGPHYELVT
jgi:peptidoglycan LD-endopeptidase CwlK